MQACSETVRLVLSLESCIKSPWIQNCRPAEVSFFLLRDLDSCEWVWRDLDSLHQQSQVDLHTEDCGILVMWYHIIWDRSLSEMGGNSHLQIQVFVTAASGPLSHNDSVGVPTISQRKRKKWFSWFSFPFGVSWKQFVALQETIPNTYRVYARRLS